MTQRDSNPWPLRCRCSALTNWATKSHSWKQVNLLGSCFPVKGMSYERDIVIWSAVFEITAISNTVLHLTFLSKDTWFFASFEAYNMAGFVGRRNKMAAMHFKQVQRFILEKKKYFGVRSTQLNQLWSKENINNYITMWWSCAQDILDLSLLAASSKMETALMGGKTWQPSHEPPCLQEDRHLSNWYTVQSRGWGRGARKITKCSTNISKGNHTVSSSIWN